MSSFQALADKFYQKGEFVYTDFSIILTREMLKLKDYKLLLLNGSQICELRDLADRTLRINVFVLPLTYDLPNDRTRFAAKVNKEAKCSFTINERCLREEGIKQLLLEDCKAEDGDIISKYKTFLSKITDGKVMQELFDINIDLPEYGVQDGRLIIVQKDLNYIDRMMIFNGENVLSLYWFEESLQNGVENMLTRFVEINKGKVTINVEFSMTGKMGADDSFVMNYNLEDSQHKKYNIKTIYNLFNRKTIF
jgi:hypothetical protein